MTDAKLHVSIVSLSTKDSVNLTKQLSKGFKRSVLEQLSSKACKSNRKRKKPIRIT